MCGTRLLINTEIVNEILRLLYFETYRFEIEIPLCSLDKSHISRFLKSFWIYVLNYLIITVFKFKDF
jgi:hypothetical protein